MGILALLARVAIGEGTHGLATADGGQAFHAVRPWGQAVPRCVQLLQGFCVQPLRIEAVVAEHLVEVLAVECVQGGEYAGPGADASIAGW